MYVRAGGREGGREKRTKTMRVCLWQYFRAAVLLRCAFGLRAGVSCYGFVRSVNQAVHFTGFASLPFPHPHRPSTGRACARVYVLSALWLLAAR